MLNILLDIDWNFFDREFMGDRVSDYIWFAGIILGTLLLKRPMAHILTRISSAIAARYAYSTQKAKIRSMLYKPMQRLLQVILYYTAMHQIDGFFSQFGIRHFIGVKDKIDVRLVYVLDHLFLFLFIIFLTQVLASFIDLVYYLRMGKAQQENNYSRMQLLPLTKEIAKLVLWTVSVFWVLGQVFHVNIPALITGLGIGGVAIALAGKETVENFFAAFTILSDKPFKTGEVIRLGEIEGTVERIGFRSTRLRNVDGSAYIIPNQNLVSQNLINLSMRNNRVVKVIANIRYGVSHETLQVLVKKIKEELLSTTPVREPVEVYIDSFDKETFQFVISYSLPHPLPSDSNLLTIKRDINMRIFDIVSAHATLGSPVIGG